MKYLKTYENYETSEIGDYAVVNYEYRDQIWQNYIQTHVGKIIDHSDHSWTKNGKGYDGYQIEYELTKDILGTFTKEEIKEYVINDNNKPSMIMNIPIFDILMTSPNKEECEVYIASNKFNL